MIDDLLNLLAVVAWGYFVLFVLLITIRAYQAGGFRHAVKNFLSMTRYCCIANCSGLFPA